MRDAPVMDAPVMSTISEGTSVDLLATYGNNQLIRYGEYTGWITP
jgi:hypothetical protein